MSEAVQGQEENSREAPAGSGGGRLIPPAILAAMPDPWPPEVDCDERAMYAATLLLALGVPCQFVTIGDDPQDPMRFTHMYVQAIREDGTKVPLDAQGPAPGWEPQWIRRKEWPIMRPAATPTVNPAKG